MTVFSVLDEDMHENHWRNSKHLFEPIIASKNKLNMLEVRKSLLARHLEFATTCIYM